MKWAFFILIVLLLVPAVNADTTILLPTSDDGPYTYGYYSSFSTMRSVATGDYIWSLTDGADPLSIYTGSSSTTNYYQSLVRVFHGFNLGTIDTEKTITGAKFGIYGTSKSNTWAEPAALELANGSPANYASIAIADYNDINFFQMAPNISYSSYSTTGWNNFTLNGDGLAYLTARRGTNATLVVTDSWDMFNTPTTWSGSKLLTMAWNSVDHTGTAQDPFLEVTWTTGGGDPPVASFDKNQTAGTAPLLVGFTDTSTNTPIAWNWSFNNVTGNNTVVWFSTAQNPSITLGTGNWTFALNASNAYGFNITPGLAWVNVSAAPEGCGLLCKMLHYFWQFRLPYQVIA